MPTRYLEERPLRVAPELVGASLASPWRRALALSFDVAIVALPTLAVTFASAALWLRLSDRPALEALRTVTQAQTSAEARRRAARDLAPLLVRIDAPGLPATVRCAVAEGRLDDAAEVVSSHDLLVVLRLGQAAEVPPPGTIVLPVEKVIPATVRGLVLLGAQAVYFTLLTWRFGATLGKGMVGIRVRRLDGGRLSLLEAFERFTGYLHIPAQLGWPLLDLWHDPNRQLPHDRTVRSVVLRASREGNESRRAAQAPEAPPGPGAEPEGQSGPDGAEPQE